MRRLLLVTWSALWLLGCESSLGTISKFEVREYNPDFRGDFSSGDFVAAGLHVSASRVVKVDDDWPGLSCAHERPAPDDTAFLRCGKLYAKAPNTTAWVEVPEPSGLTTFLGQDLDGARYFAGQNTLWVWPKGATAFDAPVPFDLSTHGEPYLHPHGFLVFAQGTQGIAPRPIENEYLSPGALRVYRHGAFTETFPTKHLDAEGNVYVLTKTGLDRVSLDGTKRDATWFTFPKSNEILQLLGVGRDGRLYALSAARTNFTGADTRKDNEIPIDALMSLGHGESEWVQASEAFSTPESRAIGYGLESGYRAHPGRDGSWWLSKCIANCSPNGANNSHQSMVWQWSKPGTKKSAPIDLEYTVWRGASVVVQLPKHADTKVWALGSAPAEAGLSVPESTPTSLTLAASATARPGTYTVTLTNEAGPSQTLKLEVKALDALTREAPRRITLTKFSVVSSGDRTLWLDVDGVVHYRDFSNVSTVVAGLPLAQSVEGEWVHARDGRVFALSANINTPYVIDATPLTLPPIHSMHHGAGLTTDGKVVLLREGAMPIEGLSDVVSLSSRLTSDVSQAGRRTWALRALTAEGREFEVDYVETYVAPRVTEVSARAISRMGVGDTAVGTDGRLVVNLSAFGTQAVKTFDSVIRYAGGAGQNAFEDAFALVVTAGGEAWVGLAPLTIPTGRTAVSMTAGGQGQYVWLDDGTVLDVPAPTSSNGEMTTVVDLPTLAVPSP